MHSRHSAHRVRRGRLALVLSLLLLGLATPARAQASDCAAAKSAERLSSALAAAPLKIESVSTSSMMANWKGYTFGGKNLLDGNLTTSWQPSNSPSGGVGEWILLRMGRPTTVRVLAIANGLQRQDELGDLFLANNRVKELCIELSDGTARRLELPGDGRGLLYFDLGAAKPDILKLRNRAATPAPL